MAGQCTYCKLCGAVPLYLIRGITFNIPEYNVRNAARIRPAWTRS